MEYIVSFLLLALNLINYEIGIGTYLFLTAGMSLVGFLTYICYSKSHSFITTCLCVMCHTWPISWVNIFGTSADTLQLPWLYIFGAIIVLWAIFNIRKLAVNKVNALVLGAFVAVFVVFVFPVFTSPSTTNALTDLIMIGFFLVLCFIAFLNSSTLNEKCRRLIISAYIFSVVISAVMIIFQFLFYSAFGEAIFKFSVGQFYSSEMLSAKLLMEDASSATIMLGSGVFFMLERFNNKDNRFLYITMIFITVIGMALTTRRTSIITLIICLAFYVMIHYKKVSKRIVMLVLMTAVVCVMFYYLMISRPTESYTQYLDDNGRFDLFWSSILLFFKAPLGVGYGDLNLAQKMGGVIPHNTILRWLNMGGIILPLLLLTIIGYIIWSANKKNLKDEKWVLIYCVFAMNFIPDILNARFFVIPCMLALLCMPREKRIPNLKLEEGKADKRYEKNIVVSSRKRKKSRM